MSLNYFDNACSYITEFAKRLGVEIRDNDAETQGKAPHFEITTLARLAVTQRFSRHVGELAKLADQLYSKEIDEPTFCDQVDEILRDMRT
jgi:hypothetical protein